MTRCSECKLKRTGTFLVARKGGRVRKIVCSEACRQTFDARFWEEQADKREARARREGR